MSRGAHVIEEIFGRRKRRGGRLLPGRLELAGGADGLLLALAHHRDVVAFAHHLDEARQVLDRRFVDARQLCAGERRFHVARMNHARQLDVHGPFEGTVHFCGNVVTMERLARVFEFRDGLRFGLTGDGVDIVPGQRDIELLSADQLAISDALGRDRLSR